MVELEGVMPASERYCSASEHLCQGLTLRGSAFTYAVGVKLLELIDNLLEEGDDFFLGSVVWKAGRIQGCVAGAMSITNSVVSDTHVIGTTV